MPPMPGFPNQNRLDIEELSSPSPSSVGGDPYNARYTVTSPPPTVASPTPSQHSDYDGLTGKKRSSVSSKATFPSSTSHKVTAASSSDTDSDSGVSGVGFGYRSQKDPQVTFVLLDLDDNVVGRLMIAGCPVKGLCSVLQ